MSSSSSSSSLFTKRIGVGLTLGTIILLTFHRIWISLDSRISSVNVPKLSVDPRDKQSGQRISALSTGPNTTDFDRQLVVLSNLRQIPPRQYQDEESLRLSGLNVFKYDPNRSIATLSSNEQTSENTPSIISNYISVTAGTTSNSFQLTRKECHTKYGAKSFLPLDQKRLPPIFYTFPGSGNTWGRLLIEHATGIFTGSVYNDRSLLEALPGEFTCDKRVSVIKVHPHTHSFAELNSGSFVSDDGKCERGGITRFKQAVLLIRNPFDSIWSEYQRRVTRSHVQGVLRRGFEWSRWQANAASLSHQYHDMFIKHYKGVEQTYGMNNTLYIKYEHLKDKQLRVAELSKIAAFLNRPATDERLQCAFVLSENEQAHRSVDDANDMTKTLAYTQPLVCRMWALIHAESLAHGYTIWRDMNCTGATGDKSYPPIRRVNVGGQGEYNKKWVQPGEALMDYGGHEAFDEEMKKQQLLQLQLQQTSLQKMDQKNVAGGGGNGNSNNNKSRQQQQQQHRYEKQQKRKEIKLQQQQQQQQQQQKSIQDSSTTALATTTIDGVFKSTTTSQKSETKQKQQQQQELQPQQPPQQQQQLFMNARGQIKRSSSSTQGLQVISENHNDIRDSENKSGSESTSKAAAIATMANPTTTSTHQSSTTVSSTTGSVSSTVGMTVGESQSIKGVGRVGEIQPAWMRR